MTNLFTLVTVAQMSIISHVGDAPVVIPLKPVTTSVPHLSWDTCQILAQQKRDGVALGEKLDVQCQPEAQDSTTQQMGTTAEQKAVIVAPASATAASVHSPEASVQSYILRAEYTVDGKPYADSQLHLSLDDCRHLIERAKEVITTQGSGHQVTFSSECIPEIRQR